MKTKSAKAKARRLQNLIAEAIRSTFDLTEEDVKPAIMGEAGVDLHLSAAANRVFPFAVEAKHQEKLNIWSAWRQAVSNAANSKPCVIFRRNRSETLAVIRLNDLLELCYGVFSKKL